MKVYPIEWLIWSMIIIFLYLIFCVDPPKEWLYSNIWGAVAGGVASLIGGRRDNRVRRKERKQAQSFSEYMANTVHQREVADLKAAGLNPILSAGGGGNPAPQGMMAPVMPTVGPAVETAMGLYRANAEVSKLEEEIKNIPLAGDLTQEQISQTAAATFQLYQMANKLSAEAHGKGLENMTLQQRTSVYQEEEFLQTIKAWSDAIGVQGSDLLNIFKMLNIKGVLKGIKNLKK